MMATYFDLFDLPVSFKVDKSALKAKLFDLQKQYHPDLSSRTADAKAISSSLINQAYETLFVDDKRAMYLLELADQYAMLDKSIADLDFLDEMMDLRLSLDECDSEECALQLLTVAEQKSHKYAEQFCCTYAKDNPNWQVAIDCAKKMQFLSNLSADIIAKKNSFIYDDSTQSDDELYV